MARPIKKGLNYFPLDVDFFDDATLIVIAGEFGAQGQLAAIKLLCTIYHKGYYVEWNDVTKYKLVRDLPGVTGDFLDKIVVRLAKCGFFDKGLFERARVLTSADIQATYFEATKRNARPATLQYLLIDVAEMGVNACKNATNKIKEKEIKVNKNKGEESASASDAAPAPDISVKNIAPCGAVVSAENIAPCGAAPSRTELISEVASGKYRRYGATEADVDAFCNYYETRGWHTASGQRVRDRRAAFGSWLGKKERFDPSTRQVRQPRSADAPVRAVLPPPVAAADRPTPQQLDALLKASGYGMRG